MKGIVEVLVSFETTLFAALYTAMLRFAQ